MREKTEAALAAGLLVVAFLFVSLSLFSTSGGVGGPPAATTVATAQCHKELAERCLGLQFLAEIPEARHSYGFVFYRAEVVTPNGERVTSWYVVTMQNGRAVDVK